MNTTMVVESFGSTCQRLAREAIVHVTHSDGARSFVMSDDSGDVESPMTDDDGWLSTVVRCDRDGNTGMVPDAGLVEARARWDEPMVSRYVAMFRDDISLYVHQWQSGRHAYGWGYITRDRVEYTGAPMESLDQYFATETRVYGEWVDGDVYGVTTVTHGAQQWDIGAHGAYLTGEFDPDVAEVWGMYGYTDWADMIESAYDVPIVEFH